MDLENVYAWRVNIHKMMGQEKEMHSGEIQVLKPPGWTGELCVRMQ